MNRDMVKVKRILQNTAMVLGSTLFCILLVELPLRFMGYGDLIIYEADPRLFWKPKAKQECFTKVGRKPVFVNDKGTRGRNFESEKGENIYRILSVGDSKTFGWGLKEAETYSSLAGEWLQECFGDSLEVEVINAGVNAWSYPQIYTYLKETGISYNPDLVIIGDANLWTQFSEHSSPEFVKDMMKKVWLKNLARRSAAYHFFIEVKLQTYYYKFRKKFVAVEPESDTMFKKEQNHNPNQFFEDYIAKICDLLVENDITPLLLYIPHEAEIVGDRDSRIRPIKHKLAERFQAPLADVTDVFIEYERKLYLHADPVHPNAAGNKIIAQEILKSLGYMTTSVALSLN